MSGLHSSRSPSFCFLLLVFGEVLEPWAVATHPHHAVWLLGGEQGAAADLLTPEEEAALIWWCAPITIQTMALHTFLFTSVPSVTV